VSGDRWDRGTVGRAIGSLWRVRATQSSVDSCRRPELRPGADNEREDAKPSEENDHKGTRVLQPRRCRSSVWAEQVIASRWAIHSQRWVSACVPEGVRSKYAVFWPSALFTALQDEQVRWAVSL
jgi:hypothetical protein